MPTIQTTNERLASLEQKIDRALKLINPEIDEANANKELFDKFDEFKKEMKYYVEDLKKSSVEIYDDDNESPNFDKNMWYFVSTSFTLSIIMSAIAYKVSMPMFPFAFALLFTFGMLMLVLLQDKFILAGKTLRRIARNALSASIFLFMCAVITVAGFFIGTSFVSDPFGGEEGNSKPKQIRYIENPAPSRNSDELRLGNGEATED